MEFSVLNASRPGEVRLAKKSEIDFAGKRWIIPPERMKAGREHRVPLSDRSMGILQSAFELHGDSDLIFPNRRGAPFSDTAFVMVLRRLGHNFVMHGFRSTFRDWAAEQTAFPREVCEAALAHAGKDATEGAYFRSDLFEKRRQLMDAWATYCSTRTIAPSAT
jgi:integrase